MSFFDKVYSKVFGEPSKSKPLEESGLLKRGDHFIRLFEDWKSKGRKDEVIDQIRSAIVLKAKGIDQEPLITLLDSTSSKGVFIRYSNVFQPHEFSYLIDHFSERILDEFNYKVGNADFRMIEQESNVLTIERRYLKPKTNFESPLDQLFGNILLEHQLENNQSKSFKLQVNIYQDRNYLEPKDFQILQRYLFE